MGPATARTPAPLAFEDGLGQRHHLADVEGTPIEILTLREELTAVPSFEFALRERVSRLQRFRHACYGTVRGVERVDHRKTTLALVSDRVLGDRLSEILSTAERSLLPLEIDAALCLVRQIVNAVAILHETVRDASHGALATERIIVTPDARVVVVEHVLGAALGTLSMPRDRYWKELRIALPPAAGTPRFDARADVTQVGVIALALILGRPLGDDEYPARLNDIASRIGAVTADGGLAPLPDAIRSWLLRALQLDPRTSFASAIEARVEFERVLGETGYSASPAALKSFLAQYSESSAAAAAPKRPEPAAAVTAAPVAKVVVQEASTPEAAEPEGDDPMRIPSSRRRFFAAAAALIALASGGTLAARYYMEPAPVAIPTGTLVVTTSPAGAGIIVDGKPRGLSPVTLSLPAGDHVLEVATSATRRTIPVTITAGGQVSQFIDLPNAPVDIGQLQVRTEPAGAKVTVDGHFFGVSPITLEGLAAGPHTVVLENELGKVTQEVVIAAGTTASLVVPMSAPQGAPVSGWVAIAAPADVQIFENGRLIGSSRTDRIMVSVGRHEFEIVNEGLGYRAKHSVQVAPGQVSTIRLDWPKGAVSVNALPWAEVFIGGQRVGETPIGNLTLPIGTHDVVFRHPELGEQKHQVQVTLTGLARLSVDMRSK